MIATAFVLSLLAAAPTVPFASLPAPVREAVHKTLGKAAKVEKVEVEQAEGAPVYEVTVRVAGRAVELALSADGTVRGEERELTLAELPAAVRSVVEGAAPGRLVRAERVTAGAKVSHEVVVLKADGARVEVVVAADGGVTVAPATE